VSPPLPFSRFGSFANQTGGHYAEASACRQTFQKYNICAAATKEEGRTQGRIRVFDGGFAKMSPGFKGFRERGMWERYELCRVRASDSGIIVQGNDI